MREESLLQLEDEVGQSLLLGAVPGSLLTESEDGPALQDELQQLGSPGELGPGVQITEELLELS